jgi:hypothetical protein
VRPKVILGGLVALAMMGALVPAQQSAAPGSGPSQDAAAPAGLQNGPATIAPHWTKNKSFPTSIPEGTVYYIVVRGDTLWDLAGRFLNNPYLWPQIWDQNKYVQDAHWIYPGDPLVLPKLAVVAEQAGQPTPEGGPEGLGEQGLGAEGLGAEGAEGEAGAMTQLAPVTEEQSLQCAQYVVNHGEDDRLFLVGSEQGADKVALSERDIVYLNKGSNAGVKAGDLYTLHHAAYAVHHPVTGRKIGTKIETTGWIKVLLVQEDSAAAVIESVCNDIHAGDYLKPFEKVNVPMIVKQPPADLLTPPSGKANRFVVDIQNDASIAGTGDFVTIDAGTDDGVTPGSVFSVYRIMYPSVPTPRNVVGEATVVAVRDRTATAKLTHARTEIMVGDQVELR